MVAPGLVSVVAESLSPTNKDSSLGSKDLARRIAQISPVCFILHYSREKFANEAPLAWRVTCSLSVTVDRGLLSVLIERLGDPHPCLDFVFHLAYGVAVETYHGGCRSQREINQIGQHSGYPVITGGGVVVEESCVLSAGGI